MATPVVSTDSSSGLDAAVLNKYLNALKLNVKINFFELLFTASSNVVTVVGGTDSDGEVISGDLAWNAGALRIDITLTGYTNVPVMLAAISVNGSTNVEKLWCTADSNTNARLSFVSNATPGVAVDPNGDVRIMVIILGS